MSTITTMTATTRFTSDSLLRVLHKTVKVGDLDVFYREAGPKGAPTVLLLHGFPTSSQMFRNLIPALADKYHLIAPDYPGYGHSSMPARDKFGYTFDSRGPSPSGRNFPSTRFALGSLSPPG